MARILTNADLADLLADEAEEQSGTLSRAYRRAARSAFLWPETVAGMIRRGESLLELHGVGPFIARKLTEWIERPQTRRPSRSAIRHDVLTVADARALFAAKPAWPGNPRGGLEMH